MAGWNLLCPGQGAQAVGMARAWFDASGEARRVLTLAERLLGGRLGVPLTTLCFEGPSESLNRTDASQPAIFATSMACLAGICEGRGVSPSELPLDAAAGLSLGEYTALCAAGAMSFEDGLELVALRGRAMQDAAEATPGGMVALVGADEAGAAEVCDAARGGDILVCANFNAPGQVVLSGSRGACERAAAEAERRGLRAASLPVAGAFHSPLMASAASRLGEALAKVRFRPARCPVLSNVTGVPHESGSESVRTRLVEQLTSPVRWEACCRYLVSSAHGEFVELAPGRTLAGLMKRIDRSVKVTSRDEPAGGS